jgi:hypothetical protein
MSNPNVVFACIHEAFPSHRPSDQGFFRRANDGAIEQVPMDDAWPPLVRAMVSVTGVDELHGSFRGRRLISVVGSFNGIENEIVAWLDKFEILLRRMYWVRAEVYSFGGWEGGRCQFKYCAERETILSYSGAEPTLPTRWKFSCLQMPSSELPPKTMFYEQLLQRPGFATSFDGGC